jgi:chorismate mutase
MSGRRRRVSLILTATVLTATVPVPTAHADDPNPLGRLVDLAAQRLQTADPVAASKWTTGGDITDPPRVAQVLDTVSADAAASRVDDGYVRQVFTDQIDATEAVEYGRFAQWKLDPAGAPTTSPDLTASRSVIDALNKEMVTEIAAQWDSLRSPTCPTDLEGARDGVADARQLDSLYRQALTYATHSYCR